VNRRHLLILSAGTAIAWPLIARAQQRAMPVIGFLSGGSPGPFASFVAAFHEGLSETGYIEGQNLAIEYRWAEGSYDRLPALAADLVGRSVKVILAAGDEPTLVAKSATSVIPIVFLIGSDPAATGLVASFARPGGNLTGVSAMFAELVPKRFELLSELVPQVRAIALLVNPNNFQTEGVMKGMQDAAHARGVPLHILKASTEGEIDAAFGALAHLNTGALVIGPDPFFGGRREQLVGLAARHAVPTIYFAREFAASGGLISYGTDVPAVYRQAGTYVGRVLAGAKPADLPVQQPTKFELIINLKTAKALGLTMPQSLLTRADEVID
jgi:putative tryptophan/tyrosine transport system substrate-binding protein